MAEPCGLVILLLLSLAKLLVTNAKDANITCLIPDDCILPCSFRPTGTVVIHWYKQQIPVHSYYYNKDQFGLQNKHFSGRTALFNSQIPHGNASLFLKRVKVQDKGRYKCYTSTRKGNQELFVNLDVKATIQSVTMEMTVERFTCSTHNVYPVPQVTWTTDRPSAIEALQNSTIITTDHKGLFTVESTIRILGNFPNYTYFCSFISADKTQTWTASWKNQDGITHEEGHALSIPCIAPHALQNFSLIWSFTSSSKPTIILRYDTKKRHIFNLWEDQADLDQEQVLQADASLLLHNPDIEEHSGTYTCTFSGMQSRHVIQTNVNITASIQSVDKQSVQRTRWSTAASAALFLFTIIVALPGCVRRRAVENRNATHRHNGAGLAEVGHHKDLHMSTNTVNQHGSECNSLQMQLGAQDQVVRSTPHTAAVVLPSDTELIQEDKTEDAPVAENDSMEVNSLEEKY